MKKVIFVAIIGALIAAIFFVFGPEERDKLAEQMKQASVLMIR
jgi:cbb3-type cytochrome oxidase subunit 3